jgi:hypothetical protein
VWLSLFTELKILVKGTNFQSVEGIHKKMAALFTALSQNGFRRCFESWKVRMVRFVVSDGNFFEGDNMQIKQFSK